MKFDKIIWGVLLLFIGGVLLLDNFNVIEFYWRNIWDFWPVFLIILGINILFNRNNSQTGSVISLGILVIALCFLFVRGQERPERNFWWNHGRGVDVRIDDDDNDHDGNYSNLHFSEPLIAGDTVKKTVLNISGGGTSFELKGETDSLFSADVKKRFGNFSLSKTTTDSVNTLVFRTHDKQKGNRSWSIGDGGNNVAIFLNTAPVWEMQMNMGAGEIDFDLSKYKVRTVNFDGGAAELKIKLGDLLPITDVNVKTGVADVKINIPEGSGCRIKTKTGLSSRDFTGFTKISDGVYETPNYGTSTKKIFINFDGGLSSFEVDRY